MTSAIVIWCDVVLHFYWVWNGNEDCRFDSAELHLLVNSFCGEVRWIRLFSLWCFPILAHGW